MSARVKRGLSIGVLIAGLLVVGGGLWETWIAYHDAAIERSVSGKPAGSMALQATTMPYVPAMTRIGFAGGAGDGAIHISEDREYLVSLFDGHSEGAIVRLLSESVSDGLHNTSHGGLPDPAIAEYKEFWTGRTVTAAISEVLWAGSEFDDAAGVVMWQWGGEANGVSSNGAPGLFLPTGAEALVFVYKISEAEATEPYQQHVRDRAAEVSASTGLTYVPVRLMMSYVEEHQGTELYNYQAGESFAEYWYPRTEPRDEVYLDVYGEMGLPTPTAVP